MFIDITFLFAPLILMFHLPFNVFICLCRSEIHVKMNCARCLFSDGELEGIGDVDESTYENCMPNQEVFDIGGFAAIAGCLDKLKSSEKQVSHLPITAILLDHNFQMSHLILFFVLFPQFSGGDSFGRGFGQLGASFSLDISA